MLAGRLPVEDGKVRKQALRLKHAGARVIQALDLAINHRNDERPWLTDGASKIVKDFGPDRISTT